MRDDRGEVDINRELLDLHKQSMIALKNKERLKGLSTKLKNISKPEYDQFVSQMQPLIKLAIQKQNQAIKHLRQLDAELWVVQKDLLIKKLELLIKNKETLNATLSKIIQNDLDPVSSEFKKTWSCK